MTAQNTTSEKGLSHLLFFTQPYFPKVLSDLIFSPWLLATPAEKVSRAKPPGLCTGGGRCVLADMG
jgi:hypothetical protein